MWNIGSDKYSSKNTDWKNAANWKGLGMYNITKNTGAKIPARALNNNMTLGKLFQFYAPPFFYM